MQIWLFFDISDSPFPCDDPEVVHFHIVTSQAYKNCQKAQNKTVSSAKNKPVRGNTLFYRHLSKQKTRSDNTSLNFKSKGSFLFFNSLNPCTCQIEARNN